MPRPNPSTTIDLRPAAFQPWPAIADTEYNASLRRIEAAATDERPASAGLQTALREVCVLGDFAVGHVYLVAPLLGQLLPAHVWEMRNQSRFGSFVRATMSTVMAPGVGLPGQVAATLRPACIASVESDVKLLRAQAALAVGLQSAYAFPAADDAAVVAVLEFLAVVPRQRDADVENRLGSLVTAVAPLLNGPDFDDLLRFEIAHAQAADVLRHGSVRAD